MCCCEETKNAVVVNPSSKEEIEAMIKAAQDRLENAKSIYENNVSYLTSYANSVTKYRQKMEIELATIKELKKLLG